MWWNLHQVVNKTAKLFLKIFNVFHWPSNIINKLKIKFIVLIVKWDLIYSMLDLFDWVALEIWKFFGFWSHPVYFAHSFLKVFEGFGFDPL